MAYIDLFREENEQIQERYELAVERMSGILTEETVAEPYRDFFLTSAALLLDIADLYKEIENGSYIGKTLSELEQNNQKLYGELLGEAYESSYANPDYAVKIAGEAYGKLFSFLYTKLRGTIVYAFKSRKYLITIFQELLIEFYVSFEGEEPAEEKLKDIIYWFMSDYSDVLVSTRIEEQIRPEYSFAAEITMNADLTDLRYLYQYGEYISENEKQMAEHLNAMPEDKVRMIADTYTEGYRIGFIMGGKDLSIKETVNIYYRIGFERVVRIAIENFAKMGLKSILAGYSGGVPNKQYDYDHKDDQAIYMDKAYVERNLAVVRNTYETYKDIARKFAGPAVIETFGEKPFAPVNKKTAWSLDEKQQKLSVYYSNSTAQIRNEFIKNSERSFTIIAFPIPEIGQNFSEIFDEVVKINTLDYNLYQRIQQTLIDALDQGQYVYVKGKNGNRTDLRIHLYPLDDPGKQSIFENCVADVNIPVGEVFTSPVLQETEGVLHVSQVYLNELKYIDLELKFEDGRIMDYMCSNFESEEENKKYISDNVLHHHASLPMGEFAIGTNTTAYMAARKYQIADKLPILIAEKMGPHFAVGDTCYSWQEDTSIFNPDGKEIVARDNEQSILRREDISKAYYNCHTDITIPYDELGEIRVEKENGESIVLIKDGRFVLPGTEELNKPFDEE